ncbi:MAG TPA: PASTA domain-containing protein, partial [Actinomycetota bacterium]|nr:PASTA domain-containing protein [Actinomycetota bacterium]
IAYKHVREEAANPSSLNRDVPPALDSITRKALAKNAENRYTDASEMHADLQRFLSGQQVHATPLMADTTMVADRVTGTRVIDEIPYEEEPRGRPGLYVLIALLILGLFAALAWFVATRVINPGDPVKVPKLVGLDIDAAEARLDDLGLEADVEEKRSPKPEGEVLKQDPEQGETLREGDAVALVVSLGRAQIDVPDVVGLQLEEARDELEDARLKVGRVDQEASEDVPEGEVIDQSPSAGTTVDARSPVALVVSSGPEEVTVPDVVGLSEAEAVDVIQDARLRVQINRGPSDEFEEGIVAGQDPAASTEVEEGTTVVILVSEGPEARPMPDVTGQDADDAEATLESDYGLDVSQQDADPSQCGAAPPGTVCDQDPAPGTEVSPGDSAVLYVQPGQAELPGPGWAAAWFFGLAGLERLRRRDEVL